MYACYQIILQKIILMEPIPIKIQASHLPQMVLFLKINNNWCFDGTNQIQQLGHNEKPYVLII
jgi:hypothetical protein